MVSKRGDDEFLATSIAPPIVRRSGQGAGPARIVAVAFVAVVAVLWFAADRDLVDQAVDDVKSQARTRADTKLQAVEHWADAHLADVRYWAANAAVDDAIRQLDGIEPAALMDDPAQKVLRDQLVSFVDLKQLAGYSAISQDGTTIASSRDANIAISDLVDREHAGALSQILDGVARITPPQNSDPAISTGPMSHTMFAGAPVVVDGRVIAALVFRIMPGNDLVEMIRDLDPGGKFDHLVVSDSGAAVTALGDVAPLDPVSIGGRSVAEMFSSSTSSGVATEGDPTDGGDVIAWSTSDELGLGALIVVNEDLAFATLRAERRVLAAVAALIALAGAALVAVAYSLASRGRSRELEVSERRFRSLVDPSPDPVLRVRPDGTVIAANKSLLKLLGPDGSGELTDASSIVSGDGSRVPTLTELGERNSMLHEIALRWPHLSTASVPTQIERINVVDGGMHDRYYRVRLVPIIGRPNESETLIVLTDVSEDVERELRLEMMALTDALTGLPNRPAINDRLDHGLERLARPALDRGLAVMLIDLDHFKSVNDAFGHVVGDRVLLAVSDAITGVLRDGDSCGRLAGDEFVVICEHVPDLSVATELVARLSAVVNAVRIGVHDTTISVSASMGVAWTRDRADGRELFADADRAMLNAKQRLGGGGYTVAHPLGAAAVAPTPMSDLFGALGRGQFEVYYQPIVDAGGHVRAAEALLRWNHPQRGVLTPDRFLNELVESGFIGPVGSWAVSEAIAQAARWRDLGRPITVHVNVSPIELTSGVIDVLARSLELHQLDPRLICVEVTEQAFNGAVLTSGSFERLGELGVEVALDDFGTGASALSHLRQRPLHMLKLDRDFVSSIGADGDGAALDESIIRAIIGLGREHGLELVAEGVETHEQVDWLRTAGCSLFQGWAFARAMTADDFDPWARLHQAVATADAAAPPPHRVTTDH